MIAILTICMVKQFGNEKGIKGNKMAPMKISTGNHLYLKQSYFIKEGKEFFYLTTHSTHFISRLYDVEHIIKGH